MNEISRELKRQVEDEKNDKKKILEENTMLQANVRL